MPRLLSDAIFWVAVACCAVAQLLILRSVFRAPTAVEAGALPPLRRAAEAAWAIVPALALALVLAATWRALHPASDDAGARAARSGAPGGPLT